MKKLLIVCLGVFFGVQSSVWGAIREASSPENAAIESNNIPMPAAAPVSPLDRFKTESDFKNYLIERLKSVAVTHYDPNSGSYGGNATSVVEDKIPGVTVEKPFFDRIYEEAIRRSAETLDDSSSAQLDPSVLQPELRQNQVEEGAPLPYLNILLPSFDEKVRVPPLEHIPYLYTQIEILPDGLVKFDETIVVIANNQKLRYPLIKALPTYMVDNNGKSRRIEISLLGVTINNQPVDYKILERGRDTLIVPKAGFPLESGVYTYVFSYVLDRQIVRYDNFDELSWDVSGGNWNLVISRIGASVKLPPNTEPTGLQVLVGYPFHYSADKATITRIAPNVLGFSAKEPLFIAEGMPVTVTLPKGVINTPDFSKLFNWFITDYGNIIFPILGFLAIFTSYLASWKYIQRHNKKMSVKLVKTPQMLRYLLTGKFDKTSFGAFLLDLFRKNIIDLQKNDNNILLIKRTDNVRSLSRKEQVAIRHLFGSDAVLSVNDSTLPRFRKAMDYAAEDVYRKFRFFSIKLNSGYLFFSCGMLLLAQAFTAWLIPNSGSIFLGMLFVDLNIATYLVLFHLSWKKKIVRWAVRSGAVLLIGLNFVMLCGLSSLWSALFFLASWLTIAFFTKLYTRRNGLLKANIAEVAAYREYLKNNCTRISMGREFLAQQANILALGAEDAYPPADSLKDYFRLDIIKELLKRI